MLRNWDLDLGGLEVVESPYAGSSDRSVRRRLKRDLGPNVLVNVVIPEFIVPGWVPQFLHNQTSFAIKATLLFEPGVAVTSVPWHLVGPNGKEGLQAHAGGEAGHRRLRRPARQHPSTSSR